MEGENSCVAVSSKVKIGNGKTERRSEKRNFTLPSSYLFSAIFSSARAASGRVASRDHCRLHLSQASEYRAKSVAAYLDLYLEYFFF